MLCTTTSPGWRTISEKGTVACPKGCHTNTFPYTSSYLVPVLASQPPHDVQTWEGNPLRLQELDQGPTFGQQPASTTSWPAGFQSPPSSYAPPHRLFPSHAPSGWWGHGPGPQRCRPHPALQSLAAHTWSPVGCCC